MTRSSLLTTSYSTTYYMWVGEHIDIAQQGNLRSELIYQKWSRMMLFQDRTLSTLTDNQVHKCLYVLLIFFYHRSLLKIKECYFIHSHSTPTLKFYLIADIPNTHIFQRRPRKGKNRGWNDVTQSGQRDLTAYLQF